MSRAASNCPAGGTTIFYGNGVLTTQARADLTSNTLMIAIDHALDVKAPNRDPSCVRFGVAYDSLFVDNSGIVGDAYNLIGQLITAALQKNLTDQTHAQSDLYQSNLDSPSPPDGWDSAVGPTYVGDFAAFVAAHQPDVQAHVALYQNELTSGNSVLVIAHSQGNLYANETYTFMGSPSPDQFYTVALATPANNVLGQFPPITLNTQLTLNNDLILFVPGAISPGNTSNGNTPGRCGVGIGSRFRCHDVVNSYLLGDVSGPAIVNAVVNRVLKQLTIVESGAGTGTVVSTPAAIDCSTCSAYFDTGTKVSLTAAADPGSLFSMWTGDCTGTAQTITIGLTAAQTCTAIYELTTLVISKSGTGTGTVTSIPTGINCGPTCPTQAAPFNGSVQLTAIADPGSSFAGWSGNCSGTNPTTTISVTTSDESCIATFSAGGTLTITKIGTGTGTVVSMPPGINCGSTCTAPFTSSVQVMATPLPGSTFAGWGTDCSGNTPTTTINVSGNKSCTAEFNSPTAVVLNPFGTQNLSVGPFQVQAVNGLLAPIAAPADITVTLERDVISPCEGLLFSSNRTVTISQGQTLGGSLDAAGRDPLCSGSPITTRWTVLQAVETPNVKLDLSIVPIAELTVSIIR